MNASYRANRLHDLLPEKRDEGLSPAYRQLVVEPFLQRTGYGWYDGQKGNGHEVSRARCHSGQVKTFIRALSRAERCASRRFAPPSHAARRLHN